MILNSKQLEELENIQDASGEFEEESSDPDGYVEGVENALAWRRGMIERAVINIRKLLRKPADSMEGLSSGSLVYLKESKRFARVHENQEGNTELSFVGPSPLLTAAMVKPEKPSKAAKAPKAEKPAKAAKPEKEAKPAKEAKIKAEKPLKPIKVEAEKVVTKLKESKVEAPKGKAPKPEMKKEKVQVKVKASEKAKDKISVSKKANAKSSAERVTKKVPLKSKKKAVKVAAKPKVKKAAAKKAAAKSKPKAVAKKPMPKKLPRKSASKQGTGRSSSKYMMDPVADPNSYIRSNFRLMSNKELSHVTGLSEHTIRRKLGEWGLKRI